MKRFFRNLCGKRAKQTLPTVAETIGTQQQVRPVVEEPTIPLQAVPEVKPVVPQVQETVPRAEETVPKVVAAVPKVGATIPAASTALGPKETPREVKIKAPKTPVFRVTRIPPEVTVDDLKAAFLSAFPGAGAEIDTSRVTICSSCYSDGTNTAFIQFTPKTPDELNRLGNCETRQVPVGNPPRNVSVDKDFYGLTQLYSPEGRHIRADIVAICGLNGHAYGSWTGRGNLPNMWLRDFFPEDFPKCRTMIYGYNTDLKSHVNHTTLDYAKALLEELTKARRSEQERNRPIVFIAHSFGGIVLAQAIVRASEEESLHYPLFQSTRGIIFFGTPHHGFTVDDILAMLEPGSPKEPLVKVIGEGTALQGDLDKFIKCCENFKIVSFEEKHQTQRVKKNEDGTYSRGGDYITTVGPESSALLLPSTIEEILPAEGDHSNMVKFAHTGNTSYTSVVRNMRNFTLHDEIEKGHITIYSAVMNNEADALELILQKDLKMLNEKVDVEGKEKEEENTILHLAAREGHVDVLEMLLGNNTNVSAAVKLLREKVDIKVGNETGYTPLHLAAENGHEGVVEVFQRAFLNSRAGTGAYFDWEGYFDCQGESENTALHLAAFCGHEKALKALIKGGANIEAKTDSEERALHLAACMGHEKVVEVLLNGGAFIEATDSMETTALHRAAYEGRKKVVELLLNKGAKIEAKNEQGLTALHAAILNTTVKTMEAVGTVDTAGTVQILLDKGADIGVEDERGFTVLHAAAAAGSERLVDIFLDKGLSIEAMDGDGCTPLYRAAESGCEDVVKMLLKRNANVNAIGEDGAMPLNKAAKGGHAKTVSLLLENGAKVNWADQEGYTPLQRAVEEGEADVVPILLTYGADTEVKDNEKYTPLHRAAYFNNEEIVRILLNGGAKRKSRNGILMTPETLARIQGNSKVIAVFERFKKNGKA